MKIAIIGGGTAGLGAAYECQKLRLAGEAIDYIVYEGRDRLGGVLMSESVGGAILEQGPDSFLTEKQATAELCRELGMGGELIPSNDSARKTWIVVRNRLIALPDGLMFLVPTKLIPTALSPLFSLGTKIRMALEFLFPPRPCEAEDETVAALVRRHYGQQAVDRLADPLLSGIYGGDSTQLSARTVLGRMAEMETEYRSLTRGMLAAHHRMREAARARMQQMAAAPASRTPAKPPAPRGIFTAIRGGMQQVVDAVTATLDPASIRLNTPVEALSRDGAQWIVRTASGEERFDAVVVCTPAWATAPLLEPLDSELAAELAAIPYSSSITVNLLYDEQKLGPLPQGFGYLVPAIENRSMLACTFVHRKFLGRTPPGKAVFRAFLGGARHDYILDKTDEWILETVRREMSEILGDDVIPPSVAPEHVQITRWRRAMAQYAVGHQQRVQRIMDRVDQLPGLRLAGNAYDGIGVSDSIRLGRQAARDLAGKSD